MSLTWTAAQRAALLGALVSRLVATQEHSHLRCRVLGRPPTMPRLIRGSWEPKIAAFAAFTMLLHNSHTCACENQIGPQLCSAPTSRALVRKGQMACTRIRRFHSHRLRLRIASCSSSTAPPGVGLASSTRAGRLQPQQRPMTADLDAPDLSAAAHHVDAMHLPLRQCVAVCAVRLASHKHTCSYPMA